MRIRKALLAAILLITPAFLPAIGHASPTQTTPPVRKEPYRLGPEAKKMFDDIFAVVPEASCVSVSVAGASLYRRDADKSVTPASTLKVLTALIALDRLGPDHRFVTKVVGPEPVEGVIHGDVGLVGGGDPLLATSAVVDHRDIAEHSPTLLDDLADRIVASGVTVIEGGIVGDESRFDQQRSVASWPERFIDQEQSGPLSALGVNDGYDWDLGEGRTERRRSPDPARSAAAALRGLLAERGVTVRGEAASGPAAAGGTLAEIESAPLTAIIAELLLTSDNQTAELLVKELAVAAGTTGSTEHGVAVIRTRMDEMGLAAEGDHLADGSGLDPTNRLTCDQLVRILDAAGGPDGRVGRGLPVAAESGTLRNRFRDTPVAGRLRAKTGRLNGVSSLAGYVPLAGGETATFSFVVNDHDDEQRARLAQDLLVVVLSRTELPCDEVAGPIVVPGGIYAGPMGTISMFPLQTVVVPGMVLPLQVFEERYRTMVDACLANDEGFGIVLISHGSEVGGGDRRTDVGTSVRILEHRRLPDDRRLLLTAGSERIRVTRWLPDAPHPRAEVEELPDPPVDAGAVESLEHTEGALRRVLAIRRELGDEVAPSTFDLDGIGASERSFALSGMAPISILDRQRLLESPDVDARLRLLDQMLEDEQRTAEGRLRGL